MLRACFDRLSMSGGRNKGFSKTPLSLSLSKAARYPGATK